MKLLVDENIPNMTVTLLKEQGHDVLDIRGTEREGISDQELWALANEERRLLITTDKGFAKNRDSDHAGVLIVALRKPNRAAIHKHIIFTLMQYDAEEWAGLLVVAKDQSRSVWRKH